MCASAVCGYKTPKQESMESAVKYIENEEGSLRQAARLYDVPIESLRRRVNGTVKIDCRPGPGTILTNDEEALLVKYIIYGLWPIS